MDVLPAVKWDSDGAPVEKIDGAAMRDRQHRTAARNLAQPPDDAVQMLRAALAGGHDVVGIEPQEARELIRVAVGAFIGRESFEDAEAAFDEARLECPCRHSQ